MIKFIALSIFAYLVGSIPFGYIIGKINGVDVLTLGSKSASSASYNSLIFFLQ
jgi:glycerol-3-phosphate acyltransferase PlsY